MKKLLIILITFAFSLTLAASNSKSFVPGEVIIKLKKNFKKGDLNIKREIKLHHETLYIVAYEQTRSIQTVLAELRSRNDVIYAEPNYVYEIIKPSPLKKRNKDPEFSRQWGHHNTGNNSGSSQGGVKGVDVNILKAWSIIKGDSRLKIAVIDTGIDYNHPDLKDNMWTNEMELNGEPGVDDDENGYVDDIYGYDFANLDGDPIDGHGHGTHCAGVIGAIHDNLIGIKGVMNEVSMLGIKFLGDDGSGTTEDAIKSIDYAVKQKVDIMSNSWGGGAYSQALYDSIKAAEEKNIVFVAAAGNFSTDNDSTPQYPASYEIDNIISVAAHDAKGKLARFSNYGVKTVHIAAPGTDIFSTVTQGNYQKMSGTSMATPYVSGALGLLMAKEGRLPLADVKERLILTSIPEEALRGRIYKGGRLDAYNLLTDKRPLRREPKPGAWVTIDLEEPWESAHPYPNNFEETRSYHVPGAEFIRLVFRKFEIEKKYDYVQISKSDLTNFVEKISGAGENYRSQFIEGDTLNAFFKSDRSINKWGFVVDQIEVQYPEK